MKDTIIKGTGNSRYLKSNIPADITHEQLVQLLRNGTMPIDLNGVNMEGIEQLGTPLNTATLLQTETADKVWFKGDAPPDPVVDRALQKIASNLRDEETYVIEKGHVDYVTGTTTSALSWSDIAFGNGRFVIVSYNSGTANYSPSDGATWGSGIYDSGYRRCVAYGNGLFVAPSFTIGNVVYSQNGEVWSTAALTDRSWMDVVFGEDKFVAVASGTEYGAYSADGINWISMRMPSSESWSAVTYGNGKFVATATTNATAAYSTDGINWTPTTMPSVSDWYGLTYGGGKFVAVAQNKSEAAYSTDGVTWESAILPSTANWYALAYGDGMFVATAQNSDKLIYSRDGVNWEETALPASKDWYGLAYGNGKFVSVAHSDSTTYTFTITDITQTDVVNQYGFAYEGDVVKAETILDYENNAVGNAVFEIEFPESFYSYKQIAINIYVHSSTSKSGTIYLRDVSNSNLGQLINISVDTGGTFCSGTIFQNSNQGFGFSGLCGANSSALYYSRPLTDAVKLYIGAAITKIKLQIIGIRGMFA